MFKTEAAKTAFNTAITAPLGVYAGIFTNAVMDETLRVTDINADALLFGYPLFAVATAIYATQISSSAFPARRTDGSYIEDTRTDRRSLLTGSVLGIFMGSVLATGLLQYNRESAPPAPEPVKTEINLRFSF